VNTLFRGRSSTYSHHPHMLSHNSPVKCYIICRAQRCPSAHG
jgi:hypothetical protein